MKLMEEETKRREEEARLKLQREIQELKSKIKNGLFGSLSTLEESNDLVDKTFARKMLEYTTQNNLPPFYALEATPERVVPVGTNVQVLTENGVDSEEGWIAIPGFDGIEIPEGLESQGWGEITGHSTEAKVRNSSVPLPLIVQEHLYAEFREEFWKDYYPENYYELLEVSNRIREEAKVEVQPQLEELKRQEEERKTLEEQEKRERLEKEEREKQERQERIRAERLAREQAIREETDRATQAEADRIYEDVFGESESEEESGDESQPNPSLVEQLRSQLQSSSPQESAIYEIFGEGIYVDTSIVPLKWYCYIDGELEDFSSRDNALEYFKSVYTDDEDYEDGDEFEVDIRNFNTGDLIQVVHFD
ncbi:hypothetical protein QO179_23545 [Bacillus stercoris]|nr:hypothetical protein [Bacillus stercoris]